MSRKKRGHILTPSSLPLLPLFCLLSSIFYPLIPPSPGNRGSYVFKEGLEHLLHGKKQGAFGASAADGAGASSSGGVKRERDPNVISLPRKTKTQTAMSVFSKDSRIVCEKLLVARPDYQAVSTEERKQLLKDAVQAAFEALTEEALAEYTAKADAHNVANQEHYAKAMIGA